MTKIKIDNKTIGSDCLTYIIAEISANHCGNINNAFDLIQKAKDSGADAVKIQTYKADTITLDCDNPYFRINNDTIWDGKTLYDLYKEAYTPWEWQPELKQYADNIGITLFSSPFDKTAVDFLETLNIPAYKIASFEITDIPLIEYIASKGKPVIISTGIATLAEIEEAVNICKKAGNNQIALLKCTSSYPAPISSMNLATIPHMKDLFSVPAGLSDHTLNIATPIVAVTLGASIIEKHFCLSRSMGGFDAAFSLEVEEFADMVKSVRDTEKLVGNVNYSLDSKALKNRAFSRSLFVSNNIRSGEILTPENIKSVRPGYGLSPKYYNDLLGKSARKHISKGTPLNWDLIS